MPRHLFLVLFAALALAGCESTPKVNTDYNPAYAFAGKNRVAVMRPEKALELMGKGSTGPVVSDLMAGRLTRTLEAALEARGYRIVPPAEAELVVTFMVNRESKTKVTTYNAGWGYQRCWRCGPYMAPQQVDVQNYTEGTLIVDFIDTARRELVWRGISSKRLPKKASPADRDKLAREVVDAVIGAYPPKP
jgi:hypothetical protein